MQRVHPPIFGSQKNQPHLQQTPVQSSPVPNQIHQNQIQQIQSIPIQTQIQPLQIQPVQFATSKLQGIPIYPQQVQQVSYKPAVQLSPERDHYNITLLQNLERQVQELTRSEHLQRQRNQDLEKLVEQLRQNNLNHGKTEIRSSEEISSLNSEMNKLNQLLNQKNRECESLIAKVQNLDYENQSLNAKLQDIASERNKYYQTCSELSVELDVCRSDNEKLSRAYIDLKQAHELAFSEPPVQKIQYVNNEEAQLLRREIDEIRNRHRQQESENEDLIRYNKKQVEEYKEKLEQQKKKNQQLKEEIETQKVKVSQGDTYKLQLEQKIDEMSRTIVELEVHLQHSGYEEIQIMNRRVFEVEEALRLADKMNQDLTLRVEQFSKESADSAKQYDIFLRNQRDLDQANQLIEDYKKRLSNHERVLEAIFMASIENDRLHDVINHLHDDIAQHKLQLSQTVSKYELQIKNMIYEYSQYSRPTRPVIERPYY